MAKWCVNTPLPEALSAIATRVASSSAQTKRRFDALSPTDRQWVSHTQSTVSSASRLTVNFHPDRLDRNNRTVAKGIRHAGRYLPQQHTGISNGSRSAVADGDRNRWEKQLFGVADGADWTIRPVYGALDLTHDPHGGSPRFGSCFLVLQEHCFARTTFCLGDSHSGPVDVGVLPDLTAVLVGICEQAERYDGGDSPVGGTFGRLRSGRTSGPARELDGYVEAQIHGGVSLREDVACIVLDSVYLESEVADEVNQAAADYGFAVSWHDGSELRHDQVPTDFRGVGMPDLARTWARKDGAIDAACIGRFAAQIPYSEPEPRGDFAENDRQLVKYLWHCLLAFGDSSVSQ